jgi:hypothetical protein
MASEPDALLPSAGDFMTKLALAEAEEASKQAKKLAEAEAGKGIARATHEAVEPLRRGGHPTRRQDHRARGEQWPYRGAVRAACSPTRRLSIRNGGRA